MTRSCTLVRRFGLATLGALLAARFACAQPEAPNWGTTALTYEQVPGIAFTPYVSGLPYTTTTIISGQVLRVGSHPANYFGAPLTVPSGALLKYLELNFCDDTGVTGYVQASVVESDKLGNVIASAPFLQSSGTGCGSVNEDLTSLNMVGDNLNKHYWLLVYLDASAGHTVGLAGMVAGYKLQVSPAPAVATFTDVPTGNLYFQYVEALVASGLTGGCGNGLFCPNNPVTRGQMAVFLSKALGLQFQ
jgi:hypothetical protein